MRLVAFVDNGGGGAEALPDFLAEFLGNGAQVFPLLVQFLELLEGLYHIFFLCQGFCALAVGGFGFQVLLEVQIPQLPVDIYQVVELGDIQLIGVVDVAEVLLRHRAGLPPAVLDVAEVRESVFHLAGLLYQGLEFLDDGLFFGQVFLALGVQLLVIFGPFLLVGHVQRLKAGLDGGKRAYRTALQGNGGFFYGGVVVRLLHGGIFAGLCLFLGKAFIEGALDGICLLGPFHAVFTFCQLLEQFRKFCQIFLCIVHYRGLLFHFYYICGFFRYHRLNFFTHEY